MRILRMLLHLYAYLFHLVLTLFLAGIAAVGWLSESSTFNLAQIPWWSGPTLVKYLFFASLAGLLFLALAVIGRLRPLFAVWTLLVFCVMMYGYFLSPAYRYQGMDHFKDTLWLNGAALLAMIGGLSQARRPKKHHT